MTTYRAAFFGDILLTRPEHAAFSDDELRAEAMAEAERADIVCEDEDASDDEPRIGRSALRAGLRIGPWVVLHGDEPADCL